MDGVTLLSILVPTYAYPQGLAHILKRFSSLPRNVELIIFDDSPGEGLGWVVHAMSDQSTKLWYQHNPSIYGLPLGAGANWNALLDAARGEYCLLLHHDECPLDDNFLPELQFLLSSKLPPDVLMLDLMIVDDCLKPLRRAFPAWLRSFVIFQAPGYLFRRNVIGPTSTIVIRRAIAPRFNTSLRWLIDVDFYIRLFRAGYNCQESRDIRIGSVIRKTGSITSGLLDDLSLIDAEERRTLFARYPEYWLWLNANKGKSIRFVENILWIIMRGLCAMLNIFSRHMRG